MKLLTRFIIRWLSTICVIGLCYGGNKVIFRDEDGVNEGRERNTGFASSNRIPESLLIQMKNITNSDEFMRRFVVGGNEIMAAPENIGITGKRRTGIAAANPVAEFARCQGEWHSIELDKSQDPAVMWWPPCVRIRRCGGCCPAQALVCQPVEISIVNVTVLQLRYNPRNRGLFENEGLRVIPLEHHEECECNCKEKPEDCVPEIQEYRENECRCACTNLSESTSCTGPEKIWDSSECACKCRREMPCSTGFYFNLIHCRCEAIQSSLSEGEFASQRENSRKSNVSLLNL